MWVHYGKCRAAEKNVTLRNVPVRTSPPRATFSPHSCLHFFFAVPVTSPRYVSAFRSTHRRGNHAALRLIRLYFTVLLKKKKYNKRSYIDINGTKCNFVSPRSHNSSLIRKTETRINVLLLSLFNTTVWALI